MDASMDGQPRAAASAAAVCTGLLSVLTPGLWRPRWLAGVSFVLRRTQRLSIIPSVKHTVIYAVLNSATRRPTECRARPLEPKLERETVGPLFINHGVMVQVEQ